MSSPDLPPPRRAPTRRDAPLWRQAAEGIGLVVLMAAVVIGGGLVLSLIVSVVF